MTITSIKSIAVYMIPDTNACPYSSRPDTHVQYSSSPGDWNGPSSETWYTLRQPSRRGLILNFPGREVVDGSFP